MNDKNHHLLELYFAFKKNDFEKRNHHLGLITNSLLVLTQSLFDDKVIVKYYQRELEGKLFRFGLANYSLINLINGNQFTIADKALHIGDLFSINNLTRMQIEAFLIMYYLFFEEISEAEKDFRYDIYKLHGLQKQSSFKINSDFPEKAENLKKIRNEINDTVENIKNSTFYKTATESQKLKFLNPQFAKLVKSEILFKKSGLADLNIDGMWHIYSNHAHSEYIGDRQYNTAYNIDKSIAQSCSLVITMVSIMTSRLILNYKQMIGTVNNRYLLLTDEEKNHIEFWCNIKINN
jgi:hypothetical protein